MRRLNQNIRLVMIVLGLGIGLLVISSLYFYHQFIPKKEKGVIILEKEEIFLPEPKIKEELKGEFKKQPLVQKEFWGKYKEIEVLIDKLKDSDIKISQEAADKLMGMGKAAVPGLLGALLEADIGLKGEILFILGRIGDKEATPILVENLKDENAYIRRNAAEALGRIKDERATFPLSAALFDDDISVRQRSAWALGELQDGRAITSLLDRMKDEREERVKVAVVNAFGKIKDQRATPVLLSELKSISDQLYKNEVISALGEVGSPEAIADLTDYLKQLKQYEPEEPMVKFQQEYAIKIAEAALENIQSKKGGEQ